MSTKNGQRLPYNEGEHKAMIKRFVNEVEKELKLPKDICFARTNIRNVTDVRKSLMLVLYEHFEISTVVLGRIFYKNHTTVLSAKKTLKETMNFIPGLAAQHKRIVDLSKFYLSMESHLFFNHVPQYGWAKSTINQIQQS
jgi:chromosomal replication initiation ATPase DnaA